MKDTGLILATLLPEISIAQLLEIGGVDRQDIDLQVGQMVGRTVPSFPVPDSLAEPISGAAAPLLEARRELPPAQPWTSSD